MQADDYQEFTKSTSQYPAYAKVLYPVLGLVGEVGEVVSLFYDQMWSYGQGVPDGQEPFQDALLAFITVGRRCETLKKMVRGGTASLNEQQKQDIQDQVDYIRLSESGSDMANESGDICWYLCALLTDLGWKLSEALEENMAKLNARKEKGIIHNHAPDSKDHLEAKQ